MPLTYPTALSLLPDEVQEQVEENLTAWSGIEGRGRYIEENLRSKERFIPADDLAAILRALGETKSMPATEMAKSYQVLCHEKSLKGGNCTIRPQHFGRVCQRSTFRNHLQFHHHTFFHTETFVDDFLNRLVLGDPSKELTGNEKKLTMTPHAAWVTWADDGQGNNPFNFSEKSSIEERRETLKASLGLPPSSHGDNRPILAFVYELSSSIDLVRPTVADAALFVYFSPPPPGIDGHGLTKPWPADFCKYPDSEALPRPEGIHEPLSMENLISVESI